MTTKILLNLGTPQSYEASDIYQSHSYQFQISSLSIFGVKGCHPWSTDKFVQETGQLEMIHFDVMT